METFPRLIAALREAIEAMPENEALRAHLNGLMTRGAAPARFTGLRLVAPEQTAEESAGPERAPVLIAVR